MSRFAETHCSQCGCDLGPGDSGVSHCEDHAANLIAHAPLLLEAARLAEEALATAVREAETDADHRTYLDAWHAISQAVAKATTVPLRAAAEVTQ